MVTRAFVRRTAAVVALTTAGVTRTRPGVALTDAFVTSTRALVRPTGAAVPSTATLNAPTIDVDVLVIVVVDLNRDGDDPPFNAIAAVAVADDHDPVNAYGDGVSRAFASAKAFAEGDAGEAHARRA